MTKVYSKEITFCPECPFFMYNDSFKLPEGWLCYKANKIISQLSTIVNFVPEWCPLPDKTNNSNKTKEGE